MNKKQTAFVRLSKYDWCLAHDINQQRLLRLLQAETFEGIVENIGKKAALIFHGRQRCKKPNSGNFYRVIIKLKIDEKIVDSFHNAAYGYRAQYFSSEKNGELANAYTLNRLIPMAKSLLEKREKHTCPWWWVEKSLRHPSAKIWIHQGLWLRHAKREYEKLNVWEKSWHGSLTTEDKKKLKWGCLVPESETSLEIKGGCITLKGIPDGVSQKPNRTKDIHMFGFT
jgi:hypothetical protein